MRWWRRLLHRRQMEGELDSELRHHLELQVRRNISDGMTEEDARRKATLEFGGLDIAKEECRDARRLPFLEACFADLRYAGRTMRRHKSFTALAVISLTLGIGANTAIYSFMDGILLRSLPVREPESLVVMKWQAKAYAVASSGMTWSTGGSSSDPATGVVSSIFPYPALKVFLESDDILSSAFCYFVTERLSITVGDLTESVKGHYVSGDYFRGMGVSPAAGRLIVPQDDQPVASPIAVLSLRFGASRFGGAADAIGQTIRINDKPFVVVGVTPESFFGAEPGSMPDVYIPMHATEIIEPATGSGGRYTNANYYWIEIMGRLRNGVPRASAQPVLAGRFFQFANGTATTEKQKQDIPKLRVEDGATGLDSMRRRYSRAVYILMGMVALILLIACSNIASLLLARAASRQKEIAVRLGIGASRARVVRQLLTESILLSSLGGAFGVAFAWWGIRVLTALLSNGRENFTLHAELNWRVLAVTLALSLLTGLLFGIAPALRATRIEVAPALKEALPASSLRPWRTVVLKNGLLVTQVTVSLFLLVAAGLFSRTLINLRSIQLGFNRDNVLLFTIRPGAVGYRGQAAVRFYEDLREKLGALPGVESISASGRALPMGGGSMLPVIIRDAPVPAARDGGARQDLAVLTTVGPSFFKTMQIPLIAGREFAERDVADAPPVIVVNRKLARMFGLESVIGRTLVLGKNEYEIIGLVDDAISFALKEDLRPSLYLSYLQSASSPAQLTFELRTAGNPLAIAPSVREIVRRADSRVAVFDLKTQAASIDQTISSEITLAWLCSAFGALALVIACVGLYGSVAFNVARRTGEIGIRMSLGAQAWQVLWMVLKEILVVAAIGLAIGVPLVFAVSRYVKSFLYGIGPNDPLSIVAAMVLLLVSGLVAAFRPAWRASQINPIIAIRHE